MANEVTENEIIDIDVYQEKTQKLYQEWFLEYASYVILERAVPTLSDGVKPVQRRILHAMREMDDGRFHKVANIIGQTMQYHPHGDAAIGDALVNLGQKGLLIETQGNWGDICTGDKAAAPRYIEARLSHFAKEVVFNPHVTSWQLSYDGRKREPIHLPVKFPLLLAQGVEGIAVGLATKIMPHNFVELMDASIDILKNKPCNILPDFATGGTADFNNYNEGKKGGKIRVRAHMEIVDKKTLTIRSVPFGTTTTNLIDSIIKANDNGKIKIKKVVDNTAKEVEIFVEIPAGVSPEVTMSALYAFTDCEVSISPNSCVIIDDKPHFLGVNELLKLSTENTVNLLKKELEIQGQQLENKWHQAMLEKIFIGQRIYRYLETCETWESIKSTINQKLEPFYSSLRRNISEEDVVKLTEIKIKRISKYDGNKAEENIKTLEKELDLVHHHLNNLTQYTINYFRALKKKYGQNFPRKTQIATFDTIEATQVAMTNQKLYVNYKEGFVGYGLKKDEFVCECSDIDDVIVFLRNGSLKVTRISSKTFVGKDIIYVAIWKKNDERMVYNMAYKDLDTAITYVKRFAVTAITRDREYDLSKSTKGGKVLYFTANPNGETQTVTVKLNPNCVARNKEFEFDFATLAIKGRNAQGNILTKHPVSRIVQKSVGAATFGSQDIWYDEITGKLNNDKRGKYLGAFEGEDLILSIEKDNSYQLTSFDLTNRYDPRKTTIIEKFSPDAVVNVIHYEKEKQHYFVKRFKIDTPSLGKKYYFLTENSKLTFISTEANPHIELRYIKKRPAEEAKEIIDLSAFMGVKGWKAIGNRLCFHQVVCVKPAETPQQTEEIPQETEKIQKIKEQEAKPELPQAKTKQEKSKEDDKQIGEQLSLF